MRVPSVYFDGIIVVQKEEIQGMSPRFLFRASGMALLAGSLLGLIWIILSGVILPLTQADSFASPWFLVASLLMLVTTLVILPGLIGMYIYQLEHTGWVGLAGALLICLGILLFGIGFGYVSATVIPWLTTHAPELLTGALPPLLIVFVVASVLMVAVGAIPLGIATMRAAVLPRWAGLLLILSGIAGLASALPLPDTAKNYPVIASVALFFLGTGWIGYALWAERAAQQPSIEDTEHSTQQPSTEIEASS